MQGLDTRTLPRRERADAVITHLREIAFASKVVLHEPDRVFMATSIHTLGDVQLVHLRRSGLFIEVSRERDDCAPTVAMMLGSKSQATREQFGYTIDQRVGAVDMVELNQPHKTWSQTSRNGWCLKVSTDDLALPMETIRRARPALGTSPLQSMYARHLTLLTESMPILSQDLAVQQLGDATIAMSRALISSAAGDDLRTRESLHESLFQRIQMFVHDRLRDPDLSPESIAAAHHVSVRLLYRLMSTKGVQLEQWIIDQRLEGARRELASRTGRHKSIAAVAHQWAFATPSHFSRRFRDKYGVTPRDWQQAQP